MTTKARTIRVDDIVSFGEAARRIERGDPDDRYTVDAFHKWRMRHDDFPKPIKTVAGTRLYDLAELRTWITEHHA